MADGESVRDMDQVQIRLALGLRPYRFGHRTPVLYSRNQSRTNIALCKEMTKGGGKACRAAHNDSEMQETQSTPRRLLYFLHCSLASGPEEVQDLDFLLIHWLLSNRELAASVHAGLGVVVAAGTASENLSQAASSPQDCGSPARWHLEKRHETRVSAVIEVTGLTRLARAWVRC